MENIQKKFFREIDLVNLISRVFLWTGRFKIFWLAVARRYPKREQQCCHCPLFWDNNHLRLDI